MILHAESRIEIQAGYQEESVRSLFTGYISNMDPAYTLKLKVEDAMYLLRKKSVVIDMKETTLKSVCKKILDGTEFSVHEKTADAPLTVFKYKGNAAGAMAKIKENFGFCVYLDEGKLYAGGEQLNPKARIKVIYGRNVIKNKTSYQYKDANPLLVEVIGKKEDNTEVKIVEGIEGGSKMTFHMYNVTDSVTLKAIAKEKLQRFSFDGFKGSVELFFIPFAQAGGSVEYSNLNYKEDNEGLYFIKGVKYSFDPDKGLRQQVKLGGRL
jgi:hypothetical protein